MDGWNLMEERSSNVLTYNILILAMQLSFDFL